MTRDPAAVLLRARALLAVAERGFLEAGIAEDAAGAERDLRDQVALLGLRDALDAGELALFDLPHSAMDRAHIHAATGRLESAAVLAWALGLTPWLPHDEPADLTTIRDALAAADGTATLRPAAELAHAADLLAAATTVTHADPDLHRIASANVLERQQAMVWLREPRT